MSCCIVYCTFIKLKRPKVSHRKHHVFSSCACTVCMQNTVRASTQQVQHVVILLHVIALLVAAVAQHLVVAGKPALQPLRAWPPDRRCDIIRGWEFTPVEDLEPLCSFTVTQTVNNDATLQEDIRLNVVLWCASFLYINCCTSAAFCSSCVIPEGSNPWVQVVRAPRRGLIELWELILKRDKKTRRVNYTLILRYCRRDITAVHVRSLFTWEQHMNTWSNVQPELNKSIVPVCVYQTLHVCMLTLSSTELHCVSYLPAVSR